jgi:hypothetical protein
LKKKEIVSDEVLKNLHGWFYGLCKYDDSDMWKDRMYAEGQIFACREMLNDFTTKFQTMSRGYKFFPENEWFMKGYNAFIQKFSKV